MKLKGKWSSSTINQGAYEATMKKSKFLLKEHSPPIFNSKLKHPFYSNYFFPFYDPVVFFCEVRKLRHQEQEINTLKNIVPYTKASVYMIF